ncbi:MAG TPA: serine/threonine-protein kinase [Polyangiaceae bacterium]|nr:serine/threonine-protein kinase [Polyangiaceae bacterium]
MAISIGPGDRIEGKYVVERLLGRGGMGAVFVAVHEELNRRVAIKVLLPGIEQSEEALARFTREARAAAALQSDHVARVLDVGRLTNGNPYTVMELLEGEDLSALASRVGTLAIPEAVQIILQTCDAIAEAHALGIVHRDIKPANIFLARRPNGSTTVKVLDFGISKAAGLAGSGSLTASFALMGSPLYMSPEQLREARAVDGRADIWALGVTLYELLTGTTPFAAGALAEICTSILTDTPRSTRSLRPDVPEALDVVVMRCLEKSPENRFADVQELVTALESVPRDTVGGTLSADTFAAARLGLAPLSSSMPAGRTTGALSHTATASPPAGVRDRRSWALPVAVTVVVLGGAAATGQRLLRAPDAAPAVAQQPPTRVVAVVPSPPAAVIAPPPAASSSAYVAPDPPSFPIPTLVPPPALVAKSASKRAAPAAAKAPPASAPAAPAPAAAPAASAEAPTSNPLDLPFR